ncbi:MAG: diguanylate cyclase [Oscillospiraceae bacterium]|nr:diguanylate cyclase [Oscillospiraceae bacterium]
MTIRMLGEFSLCLDGRCITDSSNRAKKVWLLLAYMIYNRSRPISPEEMTALLWDEEASSNPSNALKTILHRVRTALEPLDHSAGRHLILRQDATYAWDPRIPVRLDIEDFERLCGEGTAAGSREAQIRLWQEALSLYQGSFLPRLSSERWVIPLAAHYQSLYIDTALELMTLLTQEDRREECEALCRAAVEREPYIEGFYLHWLRALIDLERQREAVAVYEEMSQLFLSNFGVMPSDELRSLYREALREVNENTVPAGVILEQLREPPDQGGALLCEYDVFKTIYQALARSVLRSGDTAHLALLSILPRNGGELPRRSLDRVVDNLRELIRTTLRRGDVAARCSVSQFILLLPQANFENSLMVCDRLTRAFQRQYPHSPAQLHTSVHPLEPNQ